MIHRLTTFAGTAIVAAGLGMAAVATAGTASALTGDKGIGTADNSAFFSEIDQAGIGYDSPAAAVSTAQQVCALLADGRPSASISSEIQKNSDLSSRQANAFVVASVKNFCPTYTGSV